MGGTTAFAQVGIQVPVKTGAAVLWYNTLSSGTYDDMSFHGGCPVIFGHKRGKYFRIIVQTIAFSKSIEGR